jgi:hypothetical protein|tara:strand:- start:408 stop:596 length:189 start_codon:yes stop_codon:yes gene_type:complete
MIEDTEDLGLKIAESPEEKLVTVSIEGAEESIRHMELELEVKKVMLNYLRGKKLRMGEKGKT